MADPLCCWCGDAVPVTKPAECIDCDNIICAKCAADKSYQCADCNEPVCKEHALCAYDTIYCNEHGCTCERCNDVYDVATMTSCDECSATACEHCMSACVGDKCTVSVCDGCVSDYFSCTLCSEPYCHECSAKLPACKSGDKCKGGSMNGTQCPTCDRGKLNPDGYCLLCKPVEEEFPDGYDLLCKLAEAGPPQDFLPPTPSRKRKAIDRIDPHANKTS